MQFLAPLQRLAFAKQAPGRVVQAKLGRIYETDTLVVSVE